MVDSSLLKNSSGAWLLKPLFFEMCDSDKSRVLYTLKPEDHKGYPSVRRLYMEMGDETEFKFAEAYFGGWPHWQRLIGATWFNDYMDDLRHELETKQLSDLRDVMKIKAKAGDIQAAKFLLDEFKRGKKREVGRPTKEAIKREAEMMFKSNEEISEDLARITMELENESIRA